MPFGPHKGEAMADIWDVDPGYLLRLHKVYMDDPEKPVYGKMRFVLSYIDKHYEEIKKKFHEIRRRYYEENPEAVDRELKRKIEERKYEWNRKHGRINSRRL